MNCTPPLINQGDKLEEEEEEEEGKQDREEGRGQCEGLIGRMVR